MAKQAITRYTDFSGGLQSATSRLLMADNELARAENARYRYKIGGVTRRYGYEQVGSTVQHGKNILGGNSYFRKDGNYSLLASANNSGDTNSDLRYLNNTTWTSIIATLPAGAKLDTESFMDNVFVVGHAEGTNEFVDTMIVDKELNSSTTNHVYAAPNGKYIAEYNGKLYIANVEVNGKKYSDRFYYSSTVTDAITFVNGDQKVEGALQLEVDSARYLKAGMTVDVYRGSSNQKLVDSLTIIDVDKKDDKITFAATDIDVEDRDEIYVEDTKGDLHLLWNTDYPNENISDFREVPPVDNATPDITGLYVYNNRLFIFTEHSIHKFDGANFVLVSDKIGTSSHNSIQEAGGMMIFVNRLGVWGYNDSGGGLNLLSRGIQNYIDAATNVGLKDSVAISDGELYRVHIGETQTVDDRTTSTSTSSTSTSSTSSSTSSTSTSSTSTSSTSTSASTSSTSTSSTSSSTSSTSQSTSTTSTSTSSTSTSTTTGIPTTSAKVLVYDSAMNAWSVDVYNRRWRVAFHHKMHGYEKAYFGDDTGRIFRGDTGYQDHNSPTHFLIETKRYHMEVPEMTKQFRTAYVYTQNGHNATLQYSIDGGGWRSAGQLSKNVTAVQLGDISGRDIAFRVSQNNDGESVVFIGLTIVWMTGDLRNANG